jgi:nicotinate phosphoribosyltransferase
LLVPVFRAGVRVYDPPPVVKVREHALASLGELDPSLTRFLNPHSYPVGLERTVNAVRTKLVVEARGIVEEETQS